MTPTPNFMVIGLQIAKLRGGGQSGIRPLPALPHSEIPGMFRVKPLIIAPPRNDVRLTSKIVRSSIL